MNRGGLFYYQSKQLNMRNHGKKWLLSMLKSSGSRKKYAQSGDYSDERNNKFNSQDYDNLPFHESMKRTMKVSNGKINTNPLERFLRNNVGRDWDEIYSEIKARIPRKLLDYENIIFWFVSVKTEIVDGEVYSLETDARMHYHFRYLVHPLTNKLIYKERNPCPKKNQTRDMDSKKLREFRENEKNNKRNRYKYWKDKEDEKQSQAEMKLKEHNRNNRDNSDY